MAIGAVAYKFTHGSQIGLPYMGHIIAIRNHDMGN